MHQLILLDYLLLSHYFQSIHLFLVFEAHKFDPSESAVPQGADNFQIVPLEFPKNFVIEFFKLLFLHNDDNNLYECFSGEFEDIIFF